MFVYECDYATMRRIGRMTPEQKKKRVELEKVYRAPPSAIKKSFSRSLEVARRKCESRALPLILYTDEKKDYERALWGISQNKKMMFSGKWRHHMTNSKDGRNNKNPLFAVNYIDREIRKDMASQVRETVQFPRNAANAMLRMNLYFFDHNVKKPYRIRMPVKEAPLSHAEVAGLEHSKLLEATKGFFTSRSFRPVDFEMTDSARRTYRGDWFTPPKGAGIRYAKHLAA